ncbi:hypothetical protein VTN96DRAFT_2699 [Rasamsonia emersonii]
MAKIDKVLLTYAGADLLFVLGGVLLLVASLVLERRTQSAPTLETAPDILLFKMVPFKAAIVNAIFVFVTFVISIPGLLMSDNRFWLKLQGWMILVCGTFTLVLGVIVWFETLRTRAELGTVWGQQTAAMQSLLQQRFQCCGYFNSTSPPFVGDSVCTTPLVAAETQGCVGPFSSFANALLDLIFTADFGVVAVDMILLICVAVVLKDRKEKERYRLIDAKVGVSAI